MVEVIDDITAQAELTRSFYKRFSIYMYPQSIHRAAKSTRSWTCNDVALCSGLTCASDYQRFLESSGAVFTEELLVMSQVNFGNNISEVRLRNQQSNDECKT